MSDFICLFEDIIPSKFRSADYEVKPIHITMARQFIEQHHYSGAMSNTGTHLHGLYLKNGIQLLGVAAWLPPTKVAAMTVNKNNWRRVVALSRLAVHPRVPTNGASFLMAASIRLIEQEQKWVSLVTYADEFCGHTGAIYRAANWQYAGMTKPQPRWEDASGRQVAKRATRTRTKQEMIDAGYRMVGYFAKHKFIKHLHQRRKPERFAA